MNSSHFQNSSFFHLVLVKKSHFHGKWTISKKLAIFGPKIAVANRDRPHGAFYLFFTGIEFAPVHSIVEKNCLFILTTIFSVKITIKNYWMRIATELKEVFVAMVEFRSWIQEKFELFWDILSILSNCICLLLHNFSFDFDFVTF